MIDRAIADDREQPGAWSGAVGAKLGRAAPEGDEGILHDLLCGFGVAEHAAGGPSRAQCRRAARRTARAPPGRRGPCVVRVRRRSHPSPRSVAARPYPRALQRAHVIARCDRREARPGIPPRQLRATPWRTCARARGARPSGRMGDACRCDGRFTCRRSQSDGRRRCRPPSDPRPRPGRRPRRPTGCCRPDPGAGFRNRSGRAGSGSA